MSSKPNHPEPVPELSQLVGLTFLSGVAGFLRDVDAGQFRLTLHRTVVRNDATYFQQLTPYFTEAGTAPGEGRLFPLDDRLLGRSVAKRKIVRTAFVEDPEEFERRLLESMQERGDVRPLSEMKARSWLAIPFLSSTAAPLVLFAESSTHNFFASDETVLKMRAMCDGFNRLLDSLAQHPFQSVKNFEIQGAPPTSGGTPDYGKVHEEFAASAPTLQHVRTFNFEAGPP